MAKLTLEGAPVNTSGNLPAIGSKAPDFNLVKSDLTNLKLSDLKGKKVILSIFPSQETGTCSASIRKFNKLAAGKKDVMVLGFQKIFLLLISVSVNQKGLQMLLPFRVTVIRNLGNYMVLMYLTEHLAASMPAVLLSLMKTER